MYTVTDTVTHRRTGTEEYKKTAENREQHLIIINTAEDIQSFKN